MEWGEFWYRIQRKNPEFLHDDDDATLKVAELKRLLKLAHDCGRKSAENAQEDGWGIFDFLK